ncbi:nuclear transport factor 2 family protein [Congregibacter variabilis]|uniref:Nuclear transport factor 2 family protein n=1 Tax=Congregibacter variabilis TaxID=3081200 RepID=A0ABZ0I7X0_9GAMM|nr:nuclear transport factor 2 family protein [Congregibacter sp. IMCC43200]
MINKAVLSLTLLLLSAMSVFADERSELAELVDEFLAGASVNDADMHRRFWSEDLVYTSSSGSRYGKEQILAGMSEAPDPEEASAVYSSDQVDIRILADGVAVVTFRLIATADDGAVDYFLNTGVFERSNGQWRASTWQATKVPKK